MWSLDEYKRAFFAVGLIGVIICFVPTAMMVVDSPAREQFSELYVLGPNHMAEGYPFNVSAGGNYLMYLDVGNHMGGSMYYNVDVKFRNASEPLANSTVPSSLPALYAYRVFLGDGQTWEQALTFSFSDVVFQGNSCSVGKIQVNNVESGLHETAAWNNESSGFFYQLFIELWAYNQTSDGLLYDGRFVSLWLNMTSNT
jgi:hypothetical protein